MMGTSSDAGKPKDPSGQAKSIEHDFAADQKLREEEEVLPLPVAEQPVACVGQPVEYDFSADLKLRDEVMDELLELSQAAPIIEQPAVSAERRAEEYDFTLDLRMIEGEEGAGADFVTRSVMPTEQAAADLEWQQVEAEFCKGDVGSAPAPTRSPHAEREGNYFQGLEAVSAPGGLPHAERDANYDSIAAAISEQLAAFAATTDRKRSAFSKFKGNRRSEGGVTGKLAWLASLEMWLVLASLSLVFQIFPAAFWNLLAIVDLRNWPWAVWVGVEVAVIVVLLALRVRQTADA